MPMAKSTLTTATGKHLLPHCWATTLSDQILVNLAVIAMSKALTSILSKRMCSEIVQSENPHSSQEPASSSNSSNATRANPTVVCNTTTAQNSLNASGIASGLFYGEKFENATINVNFSS